MGLHKSSFKEGITEVIIVYSAMSITTGSKNQTFDTNISAKLCSHNDFTCQSPRWESLANKLLSLVTLSHYSAASLRRRFCPR